MYINHFQVAGCTAFSTAVELLLLLFQRSISNYSDSLNTVVACASTILADAWLHDTPEQVALSPRLFVDRQRHVCTSSIG
jgi:hypothetical protein